jgi:hypothetical protein
MIGQLAFVRKVLLPVEAAFFNGFEGTRIRCRIGFPFRIHQPQNRGLNSNPLRNDIHSSRRNEHIQSNSRHRQEQGYTQEMV